MIKIYEMDKCGIFFTRRLCWWVAFFGGEENICMVFKRFNEIPLEKGQKLKFWIKLKTNSPCCDIK
jgi:hypothetical protein